MAFKDPSLFQDPSLFPVCQFVTLISGSPRWSGRAWKQMLPLRKQNVLGKEIQPNEMHEASLEFPGIEFSGLWERDTAPAAGSGALLRNPLSSVRKLPPDSAGEQLEREGKGFAMKFLQ